MPYHITEVHAITKLSLAENGQKALWGLSLQLFYDSFGTCMTGSKDGVTYISICPDFLELVELRVM